jgi:hypothetical protein
MPFALLSSQLIYLWAWTLSCVVFGGRLHALLLLFVDDEALSWIMTLCPESCITGSSFLTHNTSCAYWKYLAGCSMVVIPLVTPLFSFPSSDLVFVFS